ncbi:hypothetical protein PanWU01x14_211300 [Parasponia andersonii]|uniref:Uncharacterized protein n=1 Tax=Parasponia andersonii TaxID=3476 RepID=A0A2P5BTQ2_PARAD|nr:hypothetical protein PanWU01x14_211300 [Parasponia andersonii]
MINKLGFRHLQGGRHPIQESHIGPEIQIHKPPYKRARAGRAAPQAFEIPFWEVDSVVERLQPQKGKR